jgi:hypothetical protein
MEEGTPHASTPQAKTHLYRASLIVPQLQGPIARGREEETIEKLTDSALSLSKKGSQSRGARGQRPCQACFLFGFLVFSLLSRKGMSLVSLPFFPGE